MNGRTIVAIGSMFQGGQIVSLADAPFAIEGSGRWGPLDYDPEELLRWDREDPVRRHGERVLRALKSHPPVSAALERLSETRPGEVHRIFFYLSDEEAERLSWEALYEEDHEFLALEPNWRIGRIAGQLAGRQVAVREFRPPLRFMAVLSALERPAEPEWRTLREAVVKARRDGLEIDLRVIVGEEDLERAIGREIRQGLESVTSRLVPDRTPALETAINDFAPHILHFFCHGSAEAGVPRLDLATNVDHLVGESSSIRLKVARLIRLAAMKEVWLVTLNCCEGARAAGHQHSMAHSLVSSGVPAAVGMLEPIDVGDAHEFCEGFYPHVLASVLEFLRATAEDDTGVVEWLDALQCSRIHLSERHRDPEINRQWTLPVLYLRPEAFQLRRVAVPTDRAIRRRVDEVAGALRALPPETPQVFRDALLDLLAEVDESLRPDVYGNFPRG